MKTQIDEWLEAFQTVASHVDSDLVLACLLDQIGKDARVKAMMQESPRGTATTKPGERTVLRGEEPASGAQIEFLSDLGVNVPAGLNKLTASQLIDGALAGR